MVLSTVTRFQSGFGHLERDCFGAAREQVAGGSKNAYMLFYERVSSIAEHKSAEQTPQIIPPALQSEMRDKSRL